MRETEVGCEDDWWWLSWEKIKRAKVGETVTGSGSMSETRKGS